MKLNNYQEGSHYYDRMGNPMYEIPCKEDPNKFRPVNIQDAIEMDLVPSVTTIIKGTLKNRALENWVLDQYAKSFMKTETKPGDTEETYIERVKENANAISKKAMEDGSKIHSLIERFLLALKDKNKPEIYSGTEESYLNQFKYFWERTSLVPLEVEKIVVNNKLDYGGKIDFIGRSLKKKQVVVCDWKTQDFKVDKKTKKREPYFYRDWGVQLAAYAAAYDQRQDHAMTLVSVVMDRTEPLIRWKIWEEKEELLEEFHHLLSLWKSPLVSNYTKRLLKFKKESSQILKEDTQ